MEMAPFAPRHILVGTDFSEPSIGALCHAALWAQRFGALLTVLYVQETPWITDNLYFGTYDLTQLTEASREASVERLAEHVGTYVPPDVSVKAEVLSGGPAAVIEEYTAAGSVDLVVVGTHGRGGIQRLLLGSVAERTLRTARQPILIVRPPSHGSSTEAATPRPAHILCPVNYSEVARHAFENACSVAQAFGARLTVAFVVEQEDSSAESSQRAEELLRSWVPVEATAEFHVQAVVRRGNAAEQLLTLGREVGVDLVVIGAQHRRFVDTTVLGVTTVRVTRHAPCPVLVVPRASV